MKLKENKLSNNIWNRTYNHTKYSWDIPTLLQYVVEEKYKTFDLPLDGIDLSWNPFDYDNVKDFINHYNRAKIADLKYPVILDDLGTVCDGWHRIVKAIIEGKKYIKAIRIEKMPVASHTEHVE
jgi:disulfide oxidoreductase YuzD